MVRGGCLILVLLEGVLILWYDLHVVHETTRLVDRLLTALTDLFWIEVFSNRGTCAEAARPVRSISKPDEKTNSAFFQLLSEFGRPGASGLDG